MPKRKDTIPKAIRNAVWRKEIGEKYSGNCYVCDNTITITDFDCAHVVSEYNGGKVQIKNLKATCRSCNLSCGTMNLIEFKRKHFGNTSILLNIYMRFRILFFIFVSSVFLFGLINIWFIVEDYFNPKDNYMDFLKIPFHIFD